MPAMSIQDLERKSSAVTLSDMEMFIFPELIYALVLANIMSPRIWAWRDDPWFAGMDKAKPYRRIVRLKQFIMDHYEFNLDLDTWGLTTKERELARFRPFLDEATLAQSNALFGYEGDKYYFDMDIRTHFGLNKYEGNVIPYWKTETVEAMDAFRHKPAYRVGAGECVSLSALYAAALFIVARIPLRDMFLMATPLHSQNFVDVDNGILTNNRRLITKTMWFNGTELSAQGRRALEHERVTYVTHESGWIHTVYPEATIAPEAWSRFANRLRQYLVTDLTPEILCNFLRQHSRFQKCFQVRQAVRGCERHIGAERVFAYEHGSSYRFSDHTRDKLMAEIDPEEFSPCCEALPGRIMLNDMEAYLRERKPDPRQAADLAALAETFGNRCTAAEDLFKTLADFCHVEPRLPDLAAKRVGRLPEPLDLDPAMTREAVVERIVGLRDAHPYATMALYAYRDLTRTEADPFLKAAFERNPVAVEAARDMEWPALTETVSAWPDESIYDGPGRLAQPDEVWNYGRGDGAEKALTLAAIAHRRRPEAPVAVEIAPTSATLRVPEGTWTFPSRKGLPAQRWTPPAAATSFPGETSSPD